MRLFVSLLAVLVAACGGPGPATCRPGAPIDCTCADGRLGQGTCGVATCACTSPDALSAEPAAVAFGEVLAGGVRDAVVLLRNSSAREVRLRSAEVGGEAPAPFSLPDGVPAAVPAGGAVPLTVRFTAGERGTSPVALLRVVPQEVGVLPVEVPVSARVPGAHLVCSPPSYLFSSVWTGSSRKTTIVCANDGSSGDEEDPRLVLDRLEVTGEGFSAVWKTRPPFGILGPGEEAEVEVTFAPTRAGLHHGTVVVVGGSRGLDQVVFDGDALETPPCDLELPGPVHHDVVEPGAATTLELTIRNRREDAPCLIEGLRLCEGTDPAYSLPDGPLGHTELRGAAELRIPLRFLPGYRSCHDPAAAGCIDIWLRDGTRTIPLTCTAPGYPASIVYPTELDFGEVDVRCGSVERTFEVNNLGTEPLVLDDVFLNDAVSEDFVLRASPPPGTALAPGASLPVTVAYRPGDRGVDMGAVIVMLAGAAEPVVVPLRGLGGGEVLVSDSFRQTDRPKLDLLFVIDNGFAMGGEAERLVPELGGLPAVLEAWGLDYHLAVTTTGLAPGGAGCPGGASGGEDGRFFPVDGARPRILDETTPDLEAAWAANLAVGTCHDGAAQVLEAAARAVAEPLATSADDLRHDEPDDGNVGFLRDGARLHVVAVTSRTEGSPRTDNWYENALRAVKGFRNPHLFRFDAITGPPTGCESTDGRWAAPGGRLIVLSSRTEGGRFASICEDGWMDALFGEDPRLFPPKTCFFPSELPWDLDEDGVLSDVSGEMRVLVDGLEVPASIGGETAWRYDPDQVMVCFEPGHVPGPGAAVVVEYYRRPC